MRTLIAAAALLVAACGTTSTPSGTPPSLAPTASTGATASTTAEPAASLPSGAIKFRVVNLRHDDSGAAAPVDVYVRTQGLVQAAPVQMSLAYGAATDSFSPPDPGTVVVTVAGAGDPTCVASCPHFISESSTNFGEGDARTIILYDDGALELWHNPDAASVGTTGNALVPADPATALLLVVGVALTNADFGLRLGFDGVAGCQVNRTSESILVGGNQVAVFAFDGPSVDASLYDSTDGDCAADPVGGPYGVTGGPGTRTLLLLYGEPGAMDGLVLPIDLAKPIDQ
jgi:hypothetical protein